VDPLNVGGSVVKCEVNDIEGCWILRKLQRNDNSTMEVQDVFAVVFPRALATAGMKAKIPKVYSYTVIV